MEPPKNHTIPPENIHIFSIGNNHFAFDVLNNITHKVNPAFARFLAGEAMPDEATHEKMKKRLDALRSWSAFPDFVQAEPVTYTSAIYRLSIEVYHTCNMDCVYCYGKASGQYVDIREKPTFEKLRRIIDYFILDFGREAKAFEINIVGAGEPLLNFELIKQIRTYARELEAQIGKKIVFWLFTNGTVFTDEIVNYILQEQQGLTISLDGPQELHDALRPLRSGAGSFDKIVNWIRQIQLLAREQGLIEPNLWVSTVITAKHKDIIAVIKTLKEIGIKSAQIRPIRTLAPSLTIQAEDVEHLKAEYQKLVDFLIEEAVQGKMEHLNIILNDRDFWGRHVLRALANSKIYFRCDAGKTKLNVMGNGDIYPCDISADLPALKMGSIRDGIDKEQQQRYLKLEVSQKEPCKTCWARYYCGGGCYVAAYMHNRDINKPDGIKCELVKKLVELAIYFVNEIRNRNSEACRKVIRFIKIRNRIVDQAYGFNNFVKKKVVEEL